MQYWGMTLKRVSYLLIFVIRTSRSQILLTLGKSSVALFFFFPFFYLDQANDLTSETFAYYASENDQTAFIPALLNAHFILLYLH